MKLGITADLYNPGQMVTAQFLKHVEKCPFMYELPQWHSNATREEVILALKKGLGGVNIIAGNNHSDLIQTKDGYIKLDIFSTTFSACVVSRTREGMLTLTALVYTAAPVAEVPCDSLRLKFWSLTSQGPQSLTRDIEAPTWEEIQANYPFAVRTDLERLMVGYAPSPSGLLILWHGQPGTGKTTALRALMQSWRPWCSAEYIVDPEKFFGEAPSYLVSVLLGQDDSVLKDANGKPMWRLLIFEDTGELITSDATSRTGQGLSRLLNVADGLIGQGLKIQVLITTNEPIDKLHAAVSRPGRAAAQVPFAEFPDREARGWLDDHDRHGEYPSGDKTLAELFAIAKGYEDRAKKSKPVGFLR
jgi:SpoVK/Ycf46/Vps4 family AAA+-type ATPase